MSFVALLGKAAVTGNFSRWRLSVPQVCGARSDDGRGTLYNFKVELCSDDGSFILATYSSFIFVTMSVGILGSTPPPHALDSDYWLGALYQGCDTDHECRSGQNTNNACSHSCTVKGGGREQCLSIKNYTCLALANLTFRGPCIVIYSYNESQRDALFIRLIW
jgi:hypothetical protein